MQYVCFYHVMVSLMMPWVWIVAIETSPEQHHQQQQQQQRASEVHSKKTVLIKTIETRDGEVTKTHKQTLANRLVIAWYSYSNLWILQAA